MIYLLNIWVKSDINDLCYQSWPSAFIISADYSVIMITGALVFQSTSDKIEIISYMICEEPFAVKNTINK